MDVKFQNSLCTCAPTKIEGYGKYIWTAGSGQKLKNIPKLPDDLFKLISAKKSTTPSTRTPSSTPATTPPETPRANDKQTQDFRALCSCLSLSQLGNYDTWVRVGMILKASVLHFLFGTRLAKGAINTSTGNAQTSGEVLPEIVLQLGAFLF